MKKIGTITFHSSYNFGSCLQAYALQEFVNKITKCNYEIINLRNNTQKYYYLSCYEKKGLKNFIKRIIYIFEYKNFKLRRINYELFINNYLNITKEVNKEELSTLNYDYYISGSDQIWNINCFDFDWNYYLEFVKKGKKISYAASFGPISNKYIVNDVKRIKNNLLQYDFISVREPSSYDIVNDIANIKPNINVDPTLLLEKKDYEKLISNRLIKGKYIYLYDIGCKKEYYELAKKISKITNMKVVVTKDNIKLVFNKNFVKCYYAGPKEFLNLINNAELVLSSSYHGTLFSIIFEKPFYTLNGDKDLRIKNILKLLHLDSRIINSDNYIDKIKDINNIDFNYCKKIINIERKRSKDYLLEALGDKIGSRKK